jgi:hypothetical protein
MSGYYCVYGEPSHTTVRYNDDKTYDIDNINDHLVFSKMGGKFVHSEHRTWPWNQDEPRISIAFEILHTEGIEHHFPENEMINHWVPI